MKKLYANVDHFDSDELIISKKDLTDKFEDYYSIDVSDYKNKFVLIDWNDEDINVYVSFDTFETLKNNLLSIMQECWSEEIETLEECFEIINKSYVDCDSASALAIVKVQKNVICAGHIDEI